jgi:hypothetical protein
VSEREAWLKLQEARAEAARLRQACELAMVELDVPDSEGQPRFCYSCTAAMQTLSAAVGSGHPEGLFRLGDFTLASGATSRYRIDCDALTPGDWAALAAMAAEVLPPFGEAVGVPRGGLPFAAALRPYATTGPLLIAEDVCSTGGSMDRFRAGRDAIGVCVFARGKVPAWVTPLFVLTGLGRPEGPGERATP